MSRRILMVCLGNICRSPLAEGILKSKTNHLNVEVESAGTISFHAGKSPDIRSIAIAKKKGIDISYQRSRKFTTSDFERFDEIYVMDRSNYIDVLQMAKTKDQKEKVKMILNLVFPGENVDVPDPYYGGDVGFENVFKMLDEACDKILEQLVKE
ncbi:low molecular weight protein-tyrosine-phosphatase [Ascidiimonas sp. W6]|uniref:low molecular weight protein-tyrosine-phosphatase n=1 Tax=Ascidiimonas meishanensis TaxID=3128903 RepID=UPI0030EB19F6